MKYDNLMIYKIYNEILYKKSNKYVGLLSQTNYFINNSRENVTLSEIQMHIGVSEIGNIPFFIFIYIYIHTHISFLLK